MVDLQEESGKTGQTSNAGETSDLGGTGGRSRGRRSGGGGLAAGGRDGLGRSRGSRGVIVGRGRSVGRLLGDLGGDLGAVMGMLAFSSSSSRILCLLQMCS